LNFSGSLVAVARWIGQHLALEGLICEG